MPKNRCRSAAWYHAANQQLCFQYKDSTIPLLPKSKILSYKPFSVAEQPCLCQVLVRKPEGRFSRDTAHISFSDPLVIYVKDSKIDELLPRPAHCKVLRQINHASMIHGADHPDIKDDRVALENVLGMLVHVA